MNPDDLEECGHEKDYQKLQEKVDKLELEKFQLQQKLTKSHYDEVYAENERLQS